MAYPIEIILHRQLADCLAIPVFIVDPEGNLLFYNEPAEDVLGMRYEDTGEMPVEQWSTAFQTKAENGDPMPPQDLPLVRTLQDHLPHHATFRIESMTGRSQKIDVTSLPIIGRTGLFEGAVAIFLKSSDS